MVDIWCQEKQSAINHMDCYFNDNTCRYAGNLYADKEAVGDYSAVNCAEVERIAARFNLTFNWLD